LSVQCQSMGRESRPAVQYWLCKNAVHILFVQQTFCRDRFLHFWKGTPEPSDSSTWLRFLFTFSPTTFGVCLLYHFSEFHVIPPTRTYGKASVSSTKTPVPTDYLVSVPVYADRPSTSRQTPGFHTLPPGVRTCAVEETFERNLWCLWWYMDSSAHVRYPHSPS
jgi:hypothetical protein